MPMYNLTQYPDNYAGSSGSLYQLKKYESPMNNTKVPLNVALDNSTSFKYKSSVLGKAADPDGNDRSLNKRKISFSTEIFIYFSRLIEMHLINYKIHLELNSNSNCTIYDVDTYAGVIMLIIGKQHLK